MTPIKFLMFILITHFLVFFVSKITLTFISVGMLFPVILLVVFILTGFPKKIALIVVALLAAHNLYRVLTIPTSLFKVQPGMTYQTEMTVVKKIYQVAENRLFSIAAVTNPYRYPTLWVYLFNQYAKTNHLPLPYYHGLTNYEYAGRGVLPLSDAKYTLEFLIIEPAINPHLVSVEKGVEDQRSKVTETFRIGEFTIEQRQPI